MKPEIRGRLWLTVACLAFIGLVLLTSCRGDLGVSPSLIEVTDAGFSMSTGSTVYFNGDSPKTLNSRLVINPVVHVSKDEVAVVAGCCNIDHADGKQHCINQGATKANQMIYDRKKHAEWEQ